MQKETHNHDGSIRCPKCSHAFPISEGILSQVRDGLSEEFEGERKRLLADVESRESNLQEKASELAAKEKTLADAVESKVAEKLELIRIEESNKASQRLEMEFADLKGQLEENQAALKEAKSKELDLLKRQREIESAKEDLELQVARKLDEEREKIREEASRIASEENQLRVAEKDKKISDLIKQVDEMKRKAEQGSMQLQGEVLELSIEEQLISSFPADRIEPVAKGVNGADVNHAVVSAMGRECGSIIYETKRTKHWQAAWVEKLKKDQLAAKAQIPVIVTRALPEGIDRFGQHEGIWVCDYESAIPLAAALRFSLIEVSREQLANEGRTEKAEVLYSYVTGTEFRQRIEAMVNYFSQMKSDLEKERRATERLWSKRETQILGIQQNIAMMFGSMEAIAGKALPTVGELELGDGSSEEEAA